MPTEATSLFDFVPGASVIPPTDETLRSLDATAKDKAMLSSVIEAADVLCGRLKFMTCESRLEAARHIAKGINSTTRMFNVAVFLRDKTEDAGAELFDEPMHKPNEDLFA